MISTRIRIALALSALVLLAGGGAWYAMAAQAKSAPGTVYRCPMHPETAYDKPGNCPICGMNLVPAEAGAAPVASSCSAGPNSGGGCCGGNEPAAPSK
jgi:hypothetical protein